LCRSSSQGVLVRCGTAQSVYVMSFVIFWTGFLAWTVGLADFVAARGTLTDLDAAEVWSLSASTVFGRVGSYLFHGQQMHQRYLSR
jgi:hypothetical protein